METKRSATLFHARSLLMELQKKLHFIRSQEHDIQAKAVKIYNDMKDDVKLLIKKFFEERTAKTEPELRDIVRDIRSHWSELEKMIYGPVVIVTHSVSFLKAQIRLWEQMRRIEIAENTEEALRIAALQKPPVGTPVSNFIVDAQSFTSEEIETFA